jgi:hypothetical protein
MKITATQIIKAINVGVEQTVKTTVITVAQLGKQGFSGVGVPIGGTAGQVLAKIDNVNYNTHWVDDLNISKFIVGEVPSGILDGINATFTSVNNFASGTLEVFLNGSLQRIINDYQVIGNNTILLNFSPNSNENILINYIKL